jgi:hypothetical protein
VILLAGGILLAGVGLLTAVTLVAFRLLRVSDLLGVACLGFSYPP